MKAASFVSDCFPEPPTPTSNAWLRSILMMRWMTVRCSRASSNSTKFILVLFSLYSSRISYRGQRMEGEKKKQNLKICLKSKIIKASDCQACSFSDILISALESAFPGNEWIGKKWTARMQCMLLWIKSSIKLMNINGTSRHLCTWNRALDAS